MEHVKLFALSDTRAAAPCSPSGLQPSPGISSFCYRILIILSPVSAELEKQLCHCTVSQSLIITNNCLFLMSLFCTLDFEPKDTPLC